MSTKFNLPVTVSISNAAGIVFHDSVSIRLEPNKYHHSGFTVRTFSGIFNSFDAKRGNYIAKGAYEVNINAIGQNVTNNVLELTDSKGTSYNIQVRLTAMGKYSVSVIVSVAIIDEVSSMIKDSTVEYRADTAANLRRKRDIAAGKQHASELRSVGLPARSDIETVSISQMIKDEYAYLG